MKKIYAVAAAAVFATAIAACGGGDGATGGGGTTEATAAGTSYQLANKSSALMGEILTQMMGGAGAQVIKEDGGTLQCQELSADSWRCTLYDNQGGSATLTGTANWNEYSFSFNAEFDNYKPDAETLLEGSFLWKFIISQNLIDMNSSVKNLFGKSAPAKSGDYDCEYDDSFDGEGYCQETNTVCSDARADLLLRFEYTIGADGFSYTDVCDTFVYGANTSMTMDYCSDDFDNYGLFTVSIAGIFNGEAINENFNAECNF